MKSAYWAPPNHRLHPSHPVAARSSAVGLGLQTRGSDLLIAGEVLGKRKARVDVRTASRVADPTGRHQSGWQSSKVSVPARPGETALDIAQELAARGLRGT